MHPGPSAGKHAPNAKPEIHSSGTKSKKTCIQNQGQERMHVTGAERRASRNMQPATGAKRGKMPI